MITLATLKDATEQQVFDQVVRHLLKQKARSEGGGYCQYRGPGGLMCAAGCLIADHEYTPEMDDFAKGSDWAALVEDDIIPTNAHKKLIIALQQLHDTKEPHNWEDELRMFAVKNKLVMPEV